MAQRFAFKHAVIREVAYDSLPFSARGQLHTRVGTWLEGADPEALDLLAHHFWNGNDEERKCRYLVRAGEAAQGRFANQAAVDYFRRAAPLLDETARGPVLMRLGAVLELRGEWDEAESVFGEALVLAEAAGDAVAVGRAHTARADPMRKQGRYEESLAELAAAEETLQAAGDRAGLGRVAHLRGTIAAQRGDYGESRTQYERSLAIRRQVGDGPAEASVLSNLAIVAEYEQDYPRAQQLNEQALELRTRLGDRWGIGVSENNLGMIAYLLRDYLAAREHLERALRIELEVGDSWMVAVARHNLGNASRELGDWTAARRHYSEALRTYASTGDKWAQCLLLEDVALLVIRDEPRTTLRLVGAADSLRESIGSPRVAAQQSELDEQLRPLHEGSGDLAAREYAAGRELTAAAATALALQLLEQAPTDATA